MYKGIYIALSGGTLKQSQMDVISHNLANAQTLGYKKDKIAFQDFLLSQLNGIEEGQESRIMSDLSAIQIDFTDGNVVRTGNALDLALEGKSFIALEGGQYTRRGDLRIQDGYLVNKNGVKVLGTNNVPLKIPAGKVEIFPGGEVAVNGVVAGTIKIVDFPDLNVLKKMGDDHFTATVQGTPSKAGVKQGYLETSNVDMIREMISLISALREFQTFQKAISAFDDTTAKVTNEMGRL